MADAVSLPDLLKVSAEAFSSAASIFPSSSAPLLPPADGISLLDTKNDLLLCYLQNLTFLVILRLRSGSAVESLDEGATKLAAATIRQLIEQRTYMDRGVKPLERRLKYQIEKALAAADDAERIQKQRPKPPPTYDAIINKSMKAAQRESSASDSDPEDSTNPATAKEDDAQTQIDELSYRPNPSALVRRGLESSNMARSSAARAGGSSSATEAYKPPRINPTSMPDPTSSTSAKSARSERRARKSHLLDEYANTELSSLPMAEPSIGSNATILARGRGALSARDREKEKELAEYEEQNFTRMPKPGKAEKKKAGGRPDRGASNSFGGEDWTGLGEVGDRVARSVSRKVDKGNVLERRDKRRREDAGGRGGGSAGLGIGEGFEKKRKILQQRAERKKAK